MTTDGHSLSWDGQVYEVNCPTYGNGYGFIPGSHAAMYVCPGCGLLVRNSPTEEKMSIRLWLARLLAPRVFYEHATMRDVLRDLVAARDRVYSCPHKELEAEAETTAYRNAWNAVVYTIKTLL